MLRLLITLAGELSAVEFFKHLHAHVRHDDMEIRVAVARALGSYPHPRTEAVLVALLEDGEWQVRTQAATSLGVIRAVNSRDALRKALADPNWWVRLRAAIALRQLGGAGSQVLRAAETGDDRFALEMARYVQGLTDEAVADYLT
jgi:HEAT repeat protein